MPSAKNSVIKLKRRQMTPKAKRRLGSDKYIQLVSIKQTQDISAEMTCVYCYRD